MSYGETGGELAVFGGVKEPGRRRRAVGKKREQASGNFAVRFGFQRGSPRMSDTGFSCCS